ncbi:hypothetical protein [Streptomyces sp. NPDC000880]
MVYPDQMALRSEGVRRVVEVGDGQVSDLRQAVDPAELATVLVGAWPLAPSGDHGLSLRQSSTGLATMPE